MTLTSFKRSSLTNSVRYEDMLVGNSAYIPSSYESIATAIGTGSSGTITFSSIPSTYKHLQLRTLARSTGTGTGGVDIRITFNGDTTSTYQYHHIVGNSTTVTAGNGSGYILAKDSCVGGAVTSGIQGVGVFDIHDYSSTTKNKTLRGINGWNNNTATGYIYLLSGLYVNTAAISSITLALGTNSFETTTKFELFGIKG